jgi:hypothetical protein
MLIHHKNSLSKKVKLFKFFLYFILQNTPQKLSPKPSPSPPNFQYMTPLSFFFLAKYDPFELTNRVWWLSEEKMEEHLSAYAFIHFELFLTHCWGNKGRKILLLIWHSTRFKRWEWDYFLIHSDIRRRGGGRSDEMRVFWKSFLAKK